MIQLDNLTKHVGSIPALVDVTFQEKGAGIAGFLGSNGDSKVTTIRIVKRFFPPKSGYARVDPPDTFYDSQGVPKTVRCRPEKTHLSKEIRTEAHLRLMPEVKGGPSTPHTIDVDQVV